eukprot:gene5427-600_t
MDVNKLGRKRRQRQPFGKRNQVWKLSDDEVKKKFSKRMDGESDEQDVWCKYRDAAQKAAEEVCGVSRGKPQHGEAWWWNQDVRGAITKKKESFRKWKKQPSDENKSCYTKDKKEAKKVVARTIKKEAEKELDGIKNSRNLVFPDVSKALGSRKNGKAGGPAGLVKEHLVTSHHGKQAILDIGNGILKEEGMPQDWRTSTVVPICKKKCSFMECSNYRGVKLLEHGQFYNVPIRFWFSLAHPSYPPLVQVKPTPSMSINVGTNIDSAGVVKSRYLEKWNRETSDLACLIQILCAEFSERIPVYSIPVRRDSGEAFFECRSSRETGRPSAVTGTHSTESDKTSASTGTSSELISSRKMETPSAATGAPSTAPGAPSTAPGATSIATGTPSMASIGRGLPSEATFKDSNEARSASVEASTTSSDIYTKRREALKLIANDLLQKTLILSDQTEKGRNVPWRYLASDKGEPEPFTNGSCYGAPLDHPPTIEEELINSLLRVLETSRDELDEETLSIRCLDRLESEIETVEEWEKSLEKKLEENAVLTEAFRKDVEKFNTPRVNRKPYQEWTNDDVCRWFHEIGMGEYAPALREHKIKGIHLPNLSKDDLIELGITKLGPRVTVDEQINKLCNDFSNIM